MYMGAERVRIFSELLTVFADIARFSARSKVFSFFHIG